MADTQRTVFPLKNSPFIKVVLLSQYIMFLTNVLLKKVKSKHVMVLLRSTGSNHQIRSFRERTGDKIEIIYFDPLIEMDCVYKEEKKIRSMKHPLTISAPFNEHTYGIITDELLAEVEAEKKAAKKSK